MAVTTVSDIKLYNKEFNAGVLEGQHQNINVFNQASKNTIRLIPEKVIGNYEKESFWKDFNPISRRDITSVADATPIKIEQEEFVNVKVARKFGPVDTTVEAFAIQGKDADRELSFIMGSKYAEYKIKDQLNTSILSGATALIGQTAVLHDGSAGTMTHSVLAAGLAKFGDQASRVQVWVMHSKVYFDLVAQAITDKIANVADVVIYGGMPGSLGRPVIVSDSASLFVTGTPDTYLTLGLTMDAIVSKDTGNQQFAMDTVLGGENIAIRTQGEYSYVLGVKGFAWDITNGGANPDDTAIGTSTNWDKVVTSDKALAGLIIKTQ